MKTSAAYADCSGLPSFSDAVFFAAWSLLRSIATTEATVQGYVLVRFGSRVLEE